MNTLRVLVVDSNPAQSERITSMLREAHHTVLRTNGLEEALEALFAQKFDAVLLGSPLRVEELVEFTAVLRRLEESEHRTVRTPVLSLWQETRVDGYLPERFEAATLSDAVGRLSAAIAQASEATKAAKGGLPVFEPEEFQAQVCHDAELLIEIIDLFLTESADQVAEMREALTAGEYERLYRTAHTIKGSLSSLHAAMAKSRAQELETAAKEHEEQVCRFSLAALEQDLQILTPQLLSLRESAGSSRGLLH